MKKTLTLVKKAVIDYDMIKPGDHIAVGVSGGKDSLMLLCALAEFSKYSKIPFKITAITLDMGFENMDFTKVINLCENLSVPYYIHPSTLAKIIFNDRKEKNPCSLCARMRRGILHDIAKEKGCNKIALGHNYDDAVITFFLNLFYGGKIGSFSPVTYLSRKDITLIRPLIYVHEAAIIDSVKRLSLPVVKSTCPADKKTKREEIKLLVSQLSEKYPDLQKFVLGGLSRANIDGWGDKF